MGWMAQAVVRVSHEPTVTGVSSIIDRSSIKRAHLPGVVVIDPPQSEYYDTTIEGSKIAFDGTSIFSVLEGIYQHFLRPKRSETALEWGSRSATMTLITTGVSQTGPSHYAGHTADKSSNGRWIIHSSLSLL